MDFELGQQLGNLKPGEKLVTTYQKKQSGDGPPYVSLGSGLATRKFPEGVSIDALEVFSDLSKEQQRLFIYFKDVLVEQMMERYQSKRTVENPNKVPLSKNPDNELHQRIRSLISVRKNGTILEEKGVLKRIKVGVYMLNPYIFIPPLVDFDEVAKIWEELLAKD